MKSTNTAALAWVPLVVTGPLLVLWGLMRSEAPDAPLPQPDRTTNRSVQQQPLRATVARVVGRVEQQDPQKKWHPVRSGDELAHPQSLRTGPKSTADVQMGNTSSVRMAAQSELAIAEFNAEASRIELRRGRLSVEHQSPNGQPLQVDSLGGQSVIASGPATFEVQRGMRSFAVATRTGMVDLLAAGRRLQVDAGKMGVATDNGVAATVRNIPAELLLKIARAPRVAPNNRLCAVIEGTASVGSRIKAGTLEYEVDETGHFRLPIPRVPGQRRNVLTITDILGRSRNETVECGKLGRSKQGMSSVEALNMQWGSQEAVDPP